MKLFICLHPSHPITPFTSSSSSSSLLKSTNSHATANVAAAAAAAAAAATARPSVMDIQEHHFEPATMIEDFIEDLYFMYYIPRQYISFTVDRGIQQYTLDQHRYTWLDQIGVVENSLILVKPLYPVQVESYLQPQPPATLNPISEQPLQDNSRTNLPYTTSYANANATSTSTSNLVSITTIVNDYYNLAMQQGACPPLHALQPNATVTLPTSSSVNHNNNYTMGFMMKEEEKEEEELDPVLLETYLGREFLRDLEQ